MTRLNSLQLTFLQEPAELLQVLKMLVSRISFYPKSTLSQLQLYASIAPIGMWLKEM